MPTREDDDRDDTCGASPDHAADFTPAIDAQSLKNEEQEINAGADSDEETLSIYRAAGKLLLCAGALCAAMTPLEPGLTRNQRIAAGTGSAVALLTGLIATRTPVRFAQAGRRHPELMACGLGGIGIASTIWGGGYRSPAFFASVATTAVGGGFVGAKAGGRYGAVAAAAYGTGVLATAKPWQPDAPSISWNTGVLSAFWAAGRVGSRIGEFALALRSLEAARARERTALRPTLKPIGDELRKRASELSERATQFDRRIVELGRAVEARGLGTVDFADGIQKDREGLRHLRSAPLLLDRPGLSTSIDQQIEQIAAANRSPDVAIEVETTNLPRALDARTESAALRILKRALDNAIQHGNYRELRIEVRATFVENHLALTVTDNGGGKLPPEGKWGLGLGRSRKDAKELGGTFNPRTALQGVAVEVSLPATEHGGSPDVESMSARTDRLVDATLRDLRIANFLQGAAVMFDRQTRRQGAIRLGRLVTLAVMGEIAVRGGSDGTPDWAIPLLALVSSAAFPAAGRPPANGWAAILCAHHNERKKRMDWLPVAATGTLIAAGGPRRALTKDLKFTIGDRTFPLVTSAVGASVGKAREEIARRERDLASTVERVAMIESVAQPIASTHDFLDGLHGTEAWQEIEELALPETVALGVAQRELRKAGDELVALLKSNTPSFTVLREQLALQLEPAPVELSGLDSLPFESFPEPRITADWALDRARRRMWLIQLADELAEVIRADAAAPITGGLNLDRVVLHFAYIDGEIELVVRPIPPATSHASDGGDRLDRIARKLDGGLAEGLTDGLRRLRLDPTVFAQ